MLNSQAVAVVFANTGSYLMPHAFPEGCPLHPSYGQGHGTVAGACSTIVKAFFDDSWVIPNPVVASEDGLSLAPYTGADAGQITIGGEINKVAANIALGRNHAAVHWRSDYQDSLILGEAVAISVLRDQRPCYSENFQGLTFTKFDGTTCGYEGRKKAPAYTGLRSTPRWVSRKRKTRDRPSLRRDSVSRSRSSLAV